MNEFFGGLTRWLVSAPFPVFSDVHHAYPGVFGAEASTVGANLAEARDEVATLTGAPLSFTLHVDHALFRVLEAKDRRLGALEPKTRLCLAFFGRAPGQATIKTRELCLV